VIAFATLSITPVAGSLSFATNMVARTYFRMCAGRVDEAPLVVVQRGDHRRAGDRVGLDKERLDRECGRDRHREGGGKLG
jgi:hypothetical protein